MKLVREIEFEILIYVDSHRLKTNLYFDVP